MEEQNHPLYSNDREIVNRLLSREHPNNADLVDLSRLLIRYEGFPGAHDLHADMSKILRLWKINREELNSKVREVWRDGYKPGSQTEEAVGSGFDTTENANN